jgi:hypothetical protein
VGEVRSPVPAGLRTGLPGDKTGPNSMNNCNAGRKGLPTDPFSRTVDRAESLPLPPLQQTPSRRGAQQGFGGKRSTSKYRLGILGTLYGEKTTTKPALAKTDKGAVPS